MKPGTPLVRSARRRLAVAVGLSTAVHALALATLRPWPSAPPAPRLIPVSLVSRGGGGGGPRPGEPAPGGEPAAPLPADPAPSPPAPPRPALTDRRAPPPVERKVRESGPRLGSRVRERRPAEVPPPAVSAAPGTGSGSGAGAGIAGGPGSGGGPGGPGTGDGTGGDGSGGARPAYGMNPKPPYPLAARRLGLEGVVLLEVLVRPDGSPAEVIVRESSGHVMLDESARTTVRTRWRFIPARRGNVPVESRVTFPVRFTLREGRLD